MNLNDILKEKEQNGDGLGNCDECGKKLVDDYVLNGMGFYCSINCINNGIKRIDEGEA